MRYPKTRSVFVHNRETNAVRPKVAGVAPDFSDLLGMRYFSQSAFSAHLVLLAFLVTLHCSAQQDSTRAVPSFRPTDTGSTVTFEIKNFGINTKGSFSGLQGRILFNPAQLAAASFDVSIDAATINTDNDMRDGHLKKESYFDVAGYPRIRFVSTKIDVADKGRYRVTGNLTIKKTTREISFPFTATPMGGDYIFNGQFTINRRDYEVGGASTISNGLTVFLTVLARRE